MDRSFRRHSWREISSHSMLKLAASTCNAVYSGSTATINIIFCRLDATSLHVVFYSDASFAGNLDLSSQIGGIILLKDKHGNAHPLHWFS
jgi:hypothetical protein